MNLKVELIRYLRRAHYEIGEQLVLGPPLEGLKAIRLRLEYLRAVVYRGQHDRLEWRHLKALRIVHLVENVEGDNALTLRQQIRLQQVANVAADLEPLRPHELHIELLDALVEGLGRAARQDLE